MSSNFRYIPKDLIQEEEAECVGDVECPAPVPNVTYIHHARTNCFWKPWENKLLKNQNFTDSALAKLLCRTKRAVNEQRRKLRIMQNWKRKNKIKYMCKNCSTIMAEKGSCDCMTLEYILIPPQDE